MNNILGIVGLAVVLMFAFNQTADSEGLKVKFTNIEHNRLKRIIKNYNEQEYTAELARKIKQLSRKYNINPFLVTGIIQRESNFKKNAVGSVGEKGLMQVTDIALEQVTKTNDLEYMPGRLQQIEYNLKAGIMYYKYCLDRAGGEYKKALAYYNGGFKNPNYDYANEVLETIRQLKEV